MLRLKVLEMHIMTPEQFWDSAKQQLYRHRATLVSSMLWGALAHMYMMANKLPNHDDITSMRGYGTGYPSGRWFLALMGDAVKNMLGNYSLPWFNGLLTILLITAAACVFNSIFEIRSTWGCILVSGIMVTFPAVTCMMNFMCTAWFYGVAILLALCSCRAIVRGWYGFWGGILGIACVTGIYQSFFMLVSGVLLLYLIARCMDERVTARELFAAGMKFLLALAAGLVLYLIINKVFLMLTQTELTDYQSIDQMGVIRLPDILLGVKTTYRTFLNMLWEDYLGITNTFFVRLLLIGTILADFAMGMLWLSGKHGICKKILFCILAFLFPAAVNGIYILCPRSPYIYALMFYSLMLVWILPLILWGGLSGTQMWRKEGVHKVSSWWVIFCVGLSALYFSRYANTVYLAMQMTYNQAESYYTTLVTRIKSVQGYRDDLKVAYIGTIQDRTLYDANVKMFDDVTLAEGSREIIGNYSWQAFLRKYLGFSPRTFKNTAKLLELDAVKQMPEYPADGSIQVVKNVVVVKFSEE